MNGAECAKLLLEIGAVELRSDPKHWFTWASGRRAPIYCDNRLLISYPDQRRLVSDALADRVRRDYPDAEVIAGTATAAIPHAAWLADRMGLPMVYVRGAAKGHGRGKRVEGRPLDGERVVLLDYTGSQHADYLEHSWHPRWNRSVALIPVRVIANRRIR